VRGLEREARTIAGLNHPHICTLHDIGQQDGIDYLVMEFLEGETLAQRLVKGSLPLHRVLQYAIEIADALDKAYRKGVTHRDLKPGNIMLTKVGCEVAGLRFGEAGAGAGSSQCAAFGTPYGERFDNCAGDNRGHFAVHGPRAIGRKASRCAVRYFCVWCSSLRNGN